ncbi:hypothetical protein CERSUDRAFT_76987 [Gelatoporia subvermispora B]|uniref:Uncharacterized protein n=1 Tax=Ceriporiopsis subvermispora (strain B) TaxID=914234 RepID=M2R415_CERS8|nr:hypothetical protein CERSUDRAFT_76987 [Gelatoporia subvermispora B]
MFISASRTFAAMLVLLSTASFIAANPVAEPESREPPFVPVRPTPIFNCVALNLHVNLVSAVRADPYTLMEDEYATFQMPARDACLRREVSAKAQLGASRATFVLRVACFTCVYSIVRHLHPPYTTAFCHERESTCAPMTQ